jgi:hypothetical protein
MQTVFDEKQRHHWPHVSDSQNPRSHGVGWLPVTSLSVPLWLLKGSVAEERCSHFCLKYPDFRNAPSLINVSANSSVIGGQMTPGRPYPFIVPKTFASRRNASFGESEPTRRKCFFSDSEDRLVPLLKRRLKEEVSERLMRWRRKKDAKYGIQPHITPTLISTILRKVSQSSS